MNIKAIEERAFELMKTHFEVFVNEIKLLCDNTQAKNKWLDSQDVCILLKISKRTLQYYRDNRIISFSQIGKKCFYKVSDVEKLLAESEIK